MSPVVMSIVASAGTVRVRLRGAGFARFAVAARVVRFAGRGLAAGVRFGLAFAVAFGRDFGAGFFARFVLAMCGEASTHERRVRRRSASSSAPAITSQPAGRLFDEHAYPPYA
jgi:hypothetical protein